VVSTFLPPSPFFPSLAACMGVKLDLARPSLSRSFATPPSRAHGLA
jgi:hypothetical protein